MHHPPPEMFVRASATNELVSTQVKELLKLAGAKPAQQVCRG
jgi:hypothetical protein